MRVCLKIASIGHLFSKPLLFIVRLAIASFAISISSGLYAQALLTLSVPDFTSINLHTDDYQGLADKVVKQALAPIGYDLKVVVLPSERSLIMSNSGVFDGELLRTRAIE